MSPPIYDEEIIASRRVGGQPVVVFRQPLRGIAVKADLAARGAWPALLHLLAHQTPGAFNEAIQCLSAAEALRLCASQPTPTLFDVRALSHYQNGHLDGAAHLSE